MKEMYFRNPSAITSCIFMKQLESVQDHGKIRKLVIKEMDRIKKKREKETGEKWDIELPKE